MATLVSEIGASVDYTNPLDPVLQIPYGALASRAEWDIAPDANNENLEPWILGIVKALANFTVNVTAEESNITTNFGGKGFAVRNNLNKITYSYTMSFFQPDITASTADPDNF